jgi:hypothetical protein
MVRDTEVTPDGISTSVPLGNDPWLISTAAAFGVKISGMSKLGMTVWIRVKVRTVTSVLETRRGLSARENCTAIPLLNYD